MFLCLEGVRGTPPPGQPAPAGKAAALSGAQACVSATRMRQHWPAAFAQKEPPSLPPSL